MMKVVEALNALVELKEENKILDKRVKELEKKLDENTIDDLKSREMNILSRRHLKKIEDDDFLTLILKKEEILLVKGLVIQREILRINNKNIYLLCEDLVRLDNNVKVIDRIKKR